MLPRISRICSITPGQPSTNPRLAKRADVLHDAGYDVRMVVWKYGVWANEADTVFDE
jgi:hypothetical protein